MASIEYRHEPIASLTHLDIRAHFYDNATVMNKPSVQDGVRRSKKSCSNYSHDGSKPQAQFWAIKLAFEQLSSALLLFVSYLSSLWENLPLRCLQFETIYVAFSKTGYFVKIFTAFRMNQVVFVLTCRCRLYEAFYSHLMLFHLSSYSHTVRKFNYSSLL